MLRHWSWLGLIGVGGPSAHIGLLRQLCVEKNEWMSEEDFEHATTAVNLLPGPASTQLAIYCAWRLRGRPGALVGGLGFIAPGFVIIVALASLFLETHPPLAILGASLGAGAAVPGIALRTAHQLATPSWLRLKGHAGSRARWVIYALAGALGTVFAAPLLVAVILLSGLVEVLLSTSATRSARAIVPLSLAHLGTIGGVGALVWVALKVGALSYGGGFVIVPLMEHDVVTNYHWMTGAQFLNAVALGQLTPGPVVLTIAVVGYAARGLTGALLASAVAFAPSFLFILSGAARFETLRTNKSAAAFLRGAGPCVIGSIAGSAILLSSLLGHLWQIPFVAASLLWLFFVRRGAVSALVLAGVAGALVVLALGHA
ncbi:MAG: chromate efflux transporter [Acidimicrobiales bacterium]